VSTALRVTASKTGLLAYCQAWARPEYEWSDTTGPAAERGTRFHKAIAAYVDTCDVGRTVEDDIAAEYAHAVAWVASLGLTAESANAVVWVGSLGASIDVLQSELAFAWDPDTDCSVMLSGGERDYTKGAGRLCGTADLVLVTAAAGVATHVTIWDWKTGSGASAGPQLRALGLMAARYYGVTSATVAALEVSRSGVTEVCREELDDFALASIAGELAEQIASIATADPIAGSHCGELYCPARLSCPLGTSATAELVPVEALTTRQAFRLTDPIVTPEHAAWALDVLRLVVAKAAAIKEDIKGKVPSDGWVLDDGRVLREGHCRSAGFDKHKALALCTQLGATPAQIASLTSDFSKSTGLRVTGGTAKPRTHRSKAVTT